MRSRLALLAALAWMLGATPAPAADVVAGPYRLALADWLVARGTSATLYYAVALHEPHAHPDGPEVDMNAYALVGKTGCTTSRDGSERTLTCRVVAPLHPVPAQSFEFDPLLETASLIVRTGKWTHRVTWTGRGEVAPFAGVTTGLVAAGLDVGAARDATARGRLFGRSLAPASERGGAALYEGVSIFAYADVPAVRFERTYRLGG